MTPNEILQHSYQCLAQSSPEKLPPAADGNKYRDPRSDIMQRMRHLGTLSPKRNFSIKSLPSGLREPHGKGGRWNRGDKGDRGHRESKALYNHCAKLV